MSSSTENEQNNFICKRLTLTPPCFKRLICLSGRYEENLDLLANHLSVNIRPQGEALEVQGHPMMVDQAIGILARLYQKTENQTALSRAEVQAALAEQAGSGGQH